MFVAIFVFTIVFSIALHELGHFVTAKAFGMKAERYFIGFGPTVWSRHVGETEYGLKAIPAGGFVKIAGMTPWEEVDPADDGRLFYQQKPWKRVIVLSAGSATHLVLAFLLLIAGLAFVGLPMSTNEVAMVVEDSPGAAAGLEPGDVIVAVDGQAVDGFAPIRDIVEGAAGETLALEVLRDSLEPGCVDELQVLFPDPWHKKRHNKRRLVSPAFLDIAHAALKPGGQLLLATDWADYADQMRELLSADDRYTNLSPSGDTVPRPESRPITRFEARGHRLGHEVFDFAFRREA